jgi:hypothetical protein
MATRQPERRRGLVGQSLEQELRATVAARQELGPDLDDALVRSFIEKIEGEIDRRIQAGIEARQKALAKQGRPAWSYVLSAVVAVTSLGIAVPVTIFASQAGPAGVAIVWIVILIINLLSLIR